MREIRFKAWLQGIGKMTYTHTLDELMNWDTKKEDNGTAVWLQYTGLKDKNGKEIYEGDIVDFEYGKGKVYWCESTAQFKVEFDTDADSLWLYCTKNSELLVIGNIYENADLY